MGRNFTSEAIAQLAALRPFRWSRDFFSGFYS